MKSYVQRAGRDIDRSCGCRRFLEPKERLPELMHPKIGLIR